jgi:microcompartment protein CcmL/EutN
MIKDKALGLIETIGLVGAIEACDASAKAADVVISAAEVVDPAYVTLKIFGELGAVQAAVESGARAAEKVGQLLSAHVIPNPDIELEMILGGRYSGLPYIPNQSAPSKRIPKNNAQPINPNIHELSSDLENMSVTDLRHFARTLAGLAIKGREISRADKQTLIREIRAAQRRLEK